MSVFTPPTVPELPGVLPETRGVQRSLFRFYGDNPRGVCVLLQAGHYVTVRNPTTDQLEATGNVDGVGFFLGGHRYTVTGAQVTALTADGYGAFIV